MKGDSESSLGSPDHARLTIENGLPSNAAAWPEGVLDALKTVRQGDVIGSLPLLYLGAPQAPVWDRTRDYSDFDGVIPVVSDELDNPSYFVLTSQTCDIVESAQGQPNHPWIQAAPVFDMSFLNSGFQKMLKKRGWRRWLWHLPALNNGFWVADLRIEIPIEKGVVTKIPVQQGHHDEPDRRAFGQRLAKRRRRAAFSDDFVAAIQRPLCAKLRELQKENAPLYALMDPDVGVYVRMDNHLAPTLVEVALITDGNVDESILNWWQAWWDEARAAADQISVILAPLQTYDTATLTVAEFRQFTELPLDRVSPD